jgi:hypothetical protein
MPHERGLLPVLPSEFCTLLSLDPNACFCRSPASHSPLVNREPSYPANPLALRHLLPMRAPRQSAWHSSGMPTLVCH